MEGSAVAPVGPAALQPVALPPWPCGPVALQPVALQPVAPGAHGVRGVGGEWPPGLGHRLPDAPPVCARDAATGAAARELLAALPCSHRSYFPCSPLFGHRYNHLVIRVGNPQDFTGSAGNP